MIDESLLSWGRYPRVEQCALRLRDRDAPFPAFEGTGLPRGNGRSYGDSCLADGGPLLDARGLDRFIAFDAATGRLACEAGTLLDDVLAVALPRGWFLPVVPGTRQATVGGAIANDVHGKNHHRAGSFGDHVLRFELLRSDGSRRIVEAACDEDGWFAATVGGLGLTGVIAWAELQLRPIAGPWLDTVSERFDRLGDFFALSAELDPAYEYTVAWIDCIADGARAGRGVFHAGNHAPAGTQGTVPRARRWRVPFAPPFTPLHPVTLRAFNEAWFRRAPASRRAAVAHYRPFFFPLDAIAHWNRAYGRRGFLQYQCVVPPAAREDAIAELLRQVARGGDGSLLAVLKNFGERAPRGVLSFPRPGTTLALDFPFRGPRTLALLDRLDAVVLEAGGALYPAKDARMSQDAFRRSFPAWERHAARVDPKLCSRFWSRVAA